MEMHDIRPLLIDDLKERILLGSVRDTVQCPNVSRSRIHKAVHGHTPVICTPVTVCSNGDDGGHATHRESAGKLFDIHFCATDRVRIVPKGYVENFHDALVGVCQWARDFARRYH
jgi:hypothetical protein